MPRHSDCVHFLIHACSTSMTFDVMSREIAHQHMLSSPQAVLLIMAGKRKININHKKKKKQRGPTKPK